MPRRANDDLIAGSQLGNWIEKLLRDGGKLVVGHRFDNGGDGFAGQTVAVCLPPHPGIAAEQQAFDGGDRQRRNLTRQNLVNRTCQND